MTTDEAVLLRLIQAVVAAHPLLVGCSSMAAELQYIMEAQQLQGYGLEYYPAKVRHGIVAAGVGLPQDSIMLLNTLRIQEAGNLINTLFSSGSQTRVLHMTVYRGRCLFQL